MDWFLVRLSSGSVGIDVWLECVVGMCGLTLGEGGCDGVEVDASFDGGGATIGLEAVDWFFGCSGLDILAACAGEAVFAKRSFDCGM